MFPTVQVSHAPPTPSLILSYQNALLTAAHRFDYQRIEAFNSSYSDLPTSLLFTDKPSREPLFQMEIRTLSGDTQFVELIPV